MKRLHIFLLLYCIILSSWGQPLDTRLAGVEKEIETLMEAYQTVGLSIAIVENQQVIYSRGFGYRNLAEKIPVTPQTVFGIGSITKQFTAALMGIYEAEGFLHLTDKPSQHIKGLEFSTAELNELVNIEDLICHRSGLGVLDGTQVFFPVHDIDKHLQRLKYLRPNAPVRSGFHYSNMGYAILGAIGEKVTGKSWEENLQKDLFDPLEMDHTSANLKALTSASNFSWGYAVSGEEVVKVLFEDQHESAAAGSINSTADDMAHWALMHLNQGHFKGQEILSESYLERAFSAHNIISPSFDFEEDDSFVFDSYGYGWFTHMYKKEYRVNHGGNVSGFSSLITLFPHRKLGIVVLTNQTSSEIRTNISNLISDLMLGIKRDSTGELEIRVGQARRYDNNIAPINEESSPSHPLSAFSGIYENKGYGILTIKEQTDYLELKLPAFPLVLEHSSGDTFINKSLFEVHQNCPSFSFNFLSNEVGEVSGLTINMQNEPVEFVKISKE